MPRLLAAMVAATMLTPLASCKLPKGSGPPAPVVSDGPLTTSAKPGSRTPAAHRSTPAAKRSKRPSRTAPSTPRPQASVVSVGKPIRNGGLTFTVTRVKNRVRRVGTLFGKRPHGRYTLVHLTVTNSGRRLRIFDGSEQRLVAHLRKYKPDFSAGTHMRSTSSFMQPIDPGDRIRTVLAFDVPTTVFHPSAIVLRASVLVTGVTVRLN